MAQQADGPPAVPPPPEPPDDSAALFAAIRADDVQQVERALSEGASVDGTVALEAEDGFECVIPAPVRVTTSAGVSLSTDKCSSPPECPKGERNMLGRSRGNRYYQP